MIRAFIAISPDEDACRHLAAALGRLVDEPLLRPIPAENLHLTLAFLGEIGTVQVDSATAAVRSVGAKLVPFGLHIDGELLALDARRRVLAVAVKGDIDPLNRLWRQLQHALAENGFPATERRFRPHLTLARIRPRASARERSAIWRAAESSLEPLHVEFGVRGLGLYRSHIGSSGASYQLLAQSEPGEAGLGPGGRTARGQGRR